MGAIQQQLNKEAYDEYFGGLKQRQTDTARHFEEGRVRSLQQRRVQLLRELDLLQRIKDALPEISDELQFPLDEFLHPTIRSYSGNDRQGDRIADIKKKLLAIEEQMGDSPRQLANRGRRRVASPRLPRGRKQ